MEGIKEIDDLKETLTLSVEGNSVRDERGVEVAVAQENKIILGSGKGTLRLIILQPITKSINDKEMKDKALEDIKKVRMVVTFSDFNSVSKVITEEICNRRGVKRKHNLQQEPEKDEGATTLTENKETPSRPSVIKFASVRSGGELDKFWICIFTFLITSFLDTSAGTSSRICGQFEAGHQVALSNTHMVGIPQSPSRVYCLLDVFEDQNIIDRNMNMVLNRIRLTEPELSISSGLGRVFETFGNSWTVKPPEVRQYQGQSPQHLVLHRFGTPPSQAGFKHLLEQVRSREIFKYIPGMHAATEEEVKNQLNMCSLSRILSNNFLERGLSYNYVLLNGGKGPVICRMW